MKDQIVPGIEEQPLRRKPHRRRRPHHGGVGIWLFFQIPNRVLSCAPSPAAPAETVPRPSREAVLGLPAVAGSDWPVSPPMSTPPPRSGGAGYWTTFVVELLLRKEVIQPHLPVRLPCYDFVPIASPTFDGSLP